MKPASVGIVVLNWNGAPDTLACLDSIRRLDYRHFTVYVVDNGSTDDSLDQLNAYHKRYSFNLIETGANLGYAGGNNIGIRQALLDGADFILLLNNDTVVSPDLLDRFIEGSHRFADAGVFSARVMYSEDPEKVWFDGARWNERELKIEWPGQGCLEGSLASTDHETDYASGAALFFRAQVAREIGLLDESFFLVWEEVDWCFRARASGWRIVVVPKAKVWHKIGASFGSESSPLRTYFSTRNQLLWFRRHASLIARIRLLARTFCRLIPRFSLGNADAFLYKRLVWALKDYVQAWFGRGSRHIYLAARRAILDHFSGRYGDCPEEVRVWSRLWSTKRSNG